MALSAITLYAPDERIGSILLISLIFALIGGRLGRHLDVDGAQHPSLALQQAPPARL